MQEILIILWWITKRTGWQKLSITQIQFYIDHNISSMRVTIDVNSRKSPTHFLFWGIFLCHARGGGLLGLKVHFCRPGIDLQINYNINKVFKKVEMSAPPNEPIFRMRLLACTLFKPWTNRANWIVNHLKSCLFFIITNLISFEN